MTNKVTLLLVVNGRLANVELSRLQLESAIRELDKVEAHMKRIGQS